MKADALSFVTPYWNGEEMMRLHLESLRAFFPGAPILISKRGGGRDEMEGHRKAYGVRYWMESCNYEDALIRLLARCETELVCIMDHDTVLLSDPAPLVEGVARGDWELVGVEERIRDHPGIDGSLLWPGNRGWMRLDPGYMDATFLLFDLRSFLARWGMRGIKPRQPRPSDYEFHYGICERLTRHKYLMPYHTRRYGVGNVIMDGATPVLWHQWYGSYRTRLIGPESDDLPGQERLASFVHQGEEAFRRDYPRLDLCDLIPAWGPERDVAAERRAIVAALHPMPTLWEEIALRAHRWSRYSPAKFVRHGWRWMERQWRLR